MAKKKSNKEVVHLRNRALEFIEKVKNGFNGVSFFGLEVNDPTNPTCDDMGEKVAAAWDRDYVLLTICADFDEFSSDNEYCQFDASQFVADFTIFAKDFFGPVEQCGFDHWYGNGEIEIYRKCPEWERWKKER